MKQLFEGHTHYVMQIAINPNDNNTFATVLSDRTVKIWHFGSRHPIFTLEGHNEGTKTCVHTLNGHAQSVSSVWSHPELSPIITGSEDSTVRSYQFGTYRLACNFCSTIKLGVFAIVSQRFLQEVKYRVRKDHTTILKVLEDLKKKFKMDEPKGNDIIAHITSLLVGLVNKEDKTYMILEFLVPIAEYGAAQLVKKIMSLCDSGRRGRAGGGDDDVKSGRRSPRRRRRRRRRIRGLKH